MYFAYIAPMKTKDVIKDKGRELFNQQGVRNVTLRHIGEELKRSYGNITYHFPNKSSLVYALYADMVQELTLVSNELFEPGSELFTRILEAPSLTFEVSFRYLFLFKDYVEIMRSFPEVAKQVKQSNAQRKAGFLTLLKTLIALGWLRDNLTDDDLYYLMELSGAMRTQFMMDLEEEKPIEELKSAFSDYTNRLLIPYLTKAGREEYEAKG